MDDIFLDTHVPTWQLSRPDSLTSEKFHAIDSHDQKGSSFYISSIIILYIIYLVGKCKILKEMLEILLQECKEHLSKLRVLQIYQYVFAVLRNIARNTAFDMPDRLLSIQINFIISPLLPKLHN